MGPMRARFALALVLSLAALAACREPQAIDLESVPERVVLPAEPGQNLIVTARVRGRAPQAVWLSPEVEGAVQLTLASAGDGRYRANLADPRFQSVLVSSPVRRFRISAGYEDGTTRSTVSVEYAVDRPAAEQAGALPEVRVERGGAAEVVRDEAWRGVDDLESVRVDWPLAPADAEVVAQVGGERIPLGVVGPNTWRLPLDQALRDRWLRAGVLRIVMREQGRAVRTVSLYPRPEALDLGGRAATFTVMQRRGLPVPGSHGFVEMRLGDVTAGQVTVEIAGRDGERLMARRSMRVGDVAVFHFGAGAYVFELTRLVNKPIGDDYAEFRLQAGAEDVLRAMRALIDEVQGARASFAGPGGPTSAGQVATELRERLGSRGALPPSVPAFLAELNEMGITVDEGTGALPLGEWLVGRAPHGSRP